MTTFFLLPWLFLDARADDDALERAYQKEYAYLVAERDALAERLRTFDASHQQRADRLRSELEATQGRLLTTQRDANRLEAELEAFDRRSASEAAGRDAVVSVLGQASASLELEAPGEAATLEQQLEALSLAFATADAQLRASSRITLSDESFFLADGTRVDGRIARAGRIAAWGISEQGGGALLPLGGGRLQVFPASSADVARRIVDGQPPSTAGAFLYESEARRVEAPRTPTWADLIEDGGPIGLVILALGGVLTGLAVWRIVAFTSAGGPQSALVDRVDELLRRGRTAEALEMARTARGSVGRVLVALLGAPSSDRADLELLAEREIEREARRLERFGTAMLVMASVAPLLGLLGTVSGMISTFDVITEFGAGNPKLLSGGISEALVTTEFGLIVAIPGVLVGNLLNSRAREILVGLDAAALVVLHENGRDAPPTPVHEPALTLEAVARARSSHA